MNKSYVTVRYRSYVTKNIQIYSHVQNIFVCYRNFFCLRVQMLCYPVVKHSFNPQQIILEKNSQFHKIHRDEKMNETQLVRFFFTIFSSQYFLHYILFKVGNESMGTPHVSKEQIFYVVYEDACVFLSVFVTCIFFLKCV